DINRPADGLMEDVVWGLLAFVVLSIGLIRTIPMRRQARYAEPEDPDVQERLREADPLGAGEALRSRSSVHDGEDILGLAEGILAVWRGRPETEVYEEGFLAIERLSEMTNDEKVERELVFFRSELVQSAQAWEQRGHASGKCGQNRPLDSQR